MPPFTPPLLRRVSLLNGPTTPPRGMVRRGRKSMGDASTIARSSSSSTRVTPTLVDSNVRVVVRIRPMNAEEERRGCRTVLYPTPTSPSHGNGSAASCQSCYTETLQRSFDFHAVYGPQATQDHVYTEAVGNAVTMNIFEGYNTTILAYGMTGSGKTYTMSERDGVISRAVGDIFQGKADRIKGLGQPVEIRMSALEIYTDELFDLLNDRRHENLKLRDHGDSVSVNGLTNVLVENEAEVKELLLRAGSQRTTSATRLNERSSRSHAVYTLSVVADRGEGEDPVTAKLTLVDLAGSEKIKASGVEGEQRRESIHINTDLFVLGKVVNALSTNMPHVPYRDSKLTRLLRDAMGGNCRTVLIACVSPADAFAEESLNTLRYAERTQSITNYCRQNRLETPLTPAQCAALQTENRMLKLRIGNLLNRTTTDNMMLAGGDGGIRSSEFSDLERKLQHARDEATAARKSCSEIALQADQFKARYEKLTREKKTTILETSNTNDESSGLSQQLRALCNENNRLYHNLLDCVQQVESKENEDNDEHQVMELRQSVEHIVQSVRTNDQNIQDLASSLIGPQLPPDDGQAKFDSLHHDIDLVNSENDILQQQNRKLQEEVQRLQEQLSANQKSAELFEVSSPVTPKRSHVDRMLDWADKEIEKGKHTPCDYSTTSTVGTDLRPQSSAQKSISFVIPENETVLSDMSQVHREAAATCACQNTIFSHKPDYVEFYLPDVRVLCSCGKQQGAELVGGDPCLLVNILRGWQAEFLHTLGIETAEQFVAAAPSRAKRFSQKMRLWRKQKGLLGVKTRSCKVAIHIWARTCKAVLKASQESKGERAKFLNVSLLNLEDDATVSTLGFSVSRLSDIEEGAI